MSVLAYLLFLLRAFCVLLLFLVVHCYIVLFLLHFQEFSSNSLSCVGVYGFCTQLLLAATKWLGKETDDQSCQTCGALTHISMSLKMMRWCPQNVLGALCLTSGSRCVVDITAEPTHAIQSGMRSLDGGLLPLMSASVWEQLKSLSGCPQRTHLVLTLQCEMQ